MITNYIIYFNTLTKELQIEQLFTIILFFMIMLIISFFIDNLQHNNSK